MIAFHTNWTAPFATRNPGAPYSVAPHELLTTMLSSLSWQALGGEIRMLTDEVGAAYYQSLGITALWNGGVFASLEGKIPSGVSPLAFWAAGKLYALRQMCAPCVMIDTDFIVWQDIAPLCADADAAVIHFEEITPDIYPDASRFNLTPGFDLEALDWSIRPSNTALAYFVNDNFRSDYVSRAISFMEHAPMADDMLTYMVFAEQRLLSMTAAACGARLISLSDLPALFLSGQTYFTHVWGFKQQMQQNPVAHDAFCRRCASRIARDFPDFAPKAQYIPALKSYFTF